jgi:NAD(P)-dependent dehydrogenase (short-subunit alcohol dehydrogenase family)
LARKLSSPSSRESRKLAPDQGARGYTVKNPLQGKIALVTGATQGIGLAIARALADEGCNLVLSGRRPTRLRAVEAELSRKKIRVLAVRCDVRDERSIAEMLAAAREKFRRLDILVNNAGIAHPNLAVGKLSAKEWNDVVTTNLTGMFLVTKASLPLMKRGAVIVNNLSIAARRTFPGLAAYNASKHGALGFTNTLREELREQGIRVIALLPGATDTAIWDVLWPEAPRKKMISPATVAQALISALKIPEPSTIEEMSLMPTTGSL